MIRRLLFLVMLVLPATLVLAACSGEDDGSGSSGASDPAGVVEGVVAASNAQDIDRVMAFFAEDAVMINGTRRLKVGTSRQALPDAALMRGQVNIEAIQVQR